MSDDPAAANRRAHLELLVEPFEENAPGAHVLAATTAIESSGLSPTMGPFATSASGRVEEVVAAAQAAIEAAFDAGATTMQLRIERD